MAAAEVQPALDGAPVTPQPLLAAAQRTNQWTVVLTAAGVVAFLNKRISPIGARHVPALQPSLNFLPHCLDCNLRLSAHALLVGIFKPIWFGG